MQLQGKLSANRFNDIVKDLRKTKNISVKIVKTLSMEDRNLDNVLTLAKEYSKYSDAILLDTKWKGGTGKTHDWNSSKVLNDNIDVPIILAGGLNHDNVVEAIKIVKPYGVDVETGVEEIVGYQNKLPVKCKSFFKIKSFIDNVRNVKQ